MRAGRANMNTPCLSPPARALAGIGLILLALGATLWERATRERDYFDPNGW